MERIDVVFKIGATSLGAITGYLFGGWDTLLQLLLVAVIIDYISGMIAASVEGKLSSKIGFKNIPKKIMIFLMVAVAHLVDQVIHDGSVLMDATIFFYLANELLSIIENSGRSGLPVPEKLKQTVEVLKGRGSNDKNF